jgi:hypothetical protein
MEGSHAVYDQRLHGTLFRLIDWADRIELDKELTERDRQVALMFYAHRCQPELEPIDPVPVKQLRLDGVVYGVCAIKREEDTPTTDEIILVHEIELESE